MMHASGSGSAQTAPIYIAGRKHPFCLRYLHDPLSWLKRAAPLKARVAYEGFQIIP
jgi:hypothetical protein